MEQVKDRNLIPSIGDIHPAFMDELELQEESEIRIATINDFSPEAARVLFQN